MANATEKDDEKFLSELASSSKDKKLETESEPVTNERVVSSMANLNALIPRDLLEDLKVVAAYNKRSIRDITEDLISRYVNRETKKMIEDMTSKLAKKNRK